MTITSDMIYIRAKQLAVKYEANVNSWPKYANMAWAELRAELADQ